MNLTDLVDLTSELQDSFGCRSFARIYVGKDTDIPVAGQVFHGDSLVDFWKLLAHHAIKTTEAVLTSWVNKSVFASFDLDAKTDVSYGTHLPS
ncbi:MAG: hypothetical protein AAGB19_05215, partial [Cyanobacteria bacterium P01_F01_bin.3]